jgi:cytochrome P450
MIRTYDLNMRNIELTDPELLRDPFAVYSRARQDGPLARLVMPGGMAMWAVLRHGDARSMLVDARFELSPASFQLRPEDVPEDYRPYLRTMQEMNGPEHARLRRLIAPAFTAARCEAFRPRIERIAHALLDELADGADLLTTFARPLPMAVICDLVGVPEADRPRWREYGTAVATGNGPALLDAIPGIVAGAQAAVAARRAEPSDDVLSALVRARDADGDRLSDTELVTLVWNIVLAGQTPANLIANAVAALLTHPAQLAALRASPDLMPAAVEELTRWCGPQLLTIPRFPSADLDFGGARIGKGEPVTAVIASANRDPRVFPDPDRLDITRAAGPHLGYAHGAHFCVAAALARTQAQVALTAVLQRFPALALAAEPRYTPDPGTWRLAELPVAC